MRIVQDAIAGTLESSDVMVKVSPPGDGGTGLDLVVTSAVMAQFGDQITAVVRDVLDRLDVTSGQVTVEDKGALDWAIRARVEAAVLRGCQADPDWATLQGVSA